MPKPVYPEGVSASPDSDQDASSELSPDVLFSFFRDFPEAVIHADGERRILAYNRAAEQLFGVDASELVGQSSRVLYADPSEWEVQGRERFSTTSRELTPYEALYRRKEGAPFWGATHGRALRGRDGAVLGYFGVIRDVSEQRRARERAHFLAQLGGLVESLDPAQLLQDVSNLAVPLLADWCAIDLLDAQGDLTRAAVAHADPEARALAMSWWSRFPPNDRDSYVHRLAKRRVSKGVVELSESLLATQSTPEAAALLRELSVKQALVVPVATRERFFGALTLASTNVRGRLYPEDQQLCELLGQRIGLALENARLYQAERDARLREGRLHQLTAGLAVVSTLEEVADVVCRIGAETSEAMIGLLWTLDGDGSLVLRGSFGGQEAVVQWVRHIPADSPLPAMAAARSGVSEFVETEQEYLARAPSAVPLARQHGALGSYATVPLRGLLGVIGVLAFRYAGWRAFSSGERSFLETLASHCGASVERALLHDQLERRARRDEFLSELSLALGQAHLGLEPVLAAAVRLCGEAFQSTAVVRLLNPERTLAEAAAFWHPDEERRAQLGPMLAHTPLRTDSGVLRLAMERQEIQHGEDTAGDKELPDGVREYARKQAVGGYVLAPLVSRGEVIGTLSMGRDSRQLYTRDDVRNLAEVAARIAVAVDNARLFEAAREGARAALEASRIKDEFLATVSHELRTPLNAILGWSTILQQDLGNRSAVEKGAEVIRRNAQSQARIIEDILDVSRIITGKLNIEPRPVDVATIVEQALEVVRPSADAKGLRLQVATCEHPVLLVGDAQRLQQVLWNLLSNAIKFTDPAGEVQVQLQQDANSVQIQVSDTGRGIAPEVLPRVFDRFHQADSSTTRRFGGLGLGLAIVRHIVELHGGSVSAHSAGLGRGATFTVVLPIRLFAPARVDDDLRVSSNPSERPPPLYDLSDVRVLVVDDEPDACELLYVLLTRAGASVESASSASDALHALPGFLPHVLVSDIGMPGEDGYELLRKVRSLPASDGGEVPAIALTAYSRDEDRSQALLAGFATHLSKPIQPNDLLAAIANLVSLRAR